MKIYIQQDGQKSGPFTPDQLREKTYSGELSRATPACVENETEWSPLDTLLSRRESPADPTPPPAAFDLEWLRDPKEMTALIWLHVAAVPAWLALGALCIAGFGIPLVLFGFVWLGAFIAEMMFGAYIKTNAVRVSEVQLPEIFRAARSCCQKLKMAPLEVYVMQENVWNAFAAKVFGRRMVVLLSGAVDSILLKGDMPQLTWLVGHELGHHWAGHLDWRHKLAKVGGWVIWLNLWRSRRAELTCDRAGLYCAGSLKASQLALLNATVGAQLASKVTIREAAAQWQSHQHEFFVRYRTLCASHPHLLARLDFLNEAAAELQIAA